MLTGLKKSLLGILTLGLTVNPALAHRHHHAIRHVEQWPRTHIAIRRDVEAPLYIYHSPYPCHSPDDCDRKDYDESGTRGRLGLGASPYHPEGPGNPSGP